MPPGTVKVQNMKKILTLYGCTGRSCTYSTKKQRQLLRPLNSLEKSILQKLREPPVLENSRLMLLILFVCMIRFFISFQQSFSYAGAGLPRFNQYQARSVLLILVMRHNGKSNNLLL